jgi:uncharacterized protein (DUF1501 family)
MNRRRFLQVAGVAGLAMMAPIASRRGYAGVTKYPGPFWIMVNAAGGWDATMLCDPKGGNATDATSVDQAFTPAQIGKAGAISYAPLTYSSGSVLVQDSASFFNAHHGRLMVANGVDTATNNHDAGSRTTWCGQLAEGYPSFAAMVAAAVTAATPVPLPFISNGGYDATAGILPLTRVGNPATLEKLAFPNTVDPTNATSDHYFSANTAARIQAAQAGRVQALAKKQSLPTVANAMSSLYLARQSDQGLVDLGEQLAGVKLVAQSNFPDLNGATGLDDLVNLFQQVQLALLAFKSGVAVSANLNYGGFDTHGNNDVRQERALMVLLRGLDYLFTQIDALGLTNQVYVVVGSDFSRTPYYNAQQGKDHWNITSMMFAGPKIPGDHVVGGTDAGFISTLVDGSTLKPSSSGERIGTANVHLALRKLAGIAGSDVDKQFPLPGDVMPLFEG